MHHFHVPLKGPMSHLACGVPRLVKSVLPTTLLRYHFLWVCPGDLRIMLSTKAAHATRREGLDRVNIVSDFSGKSHTNNCQRSWDIDDAVLVFRVSSFLSQLNLHPGSVSVRDLNAWNRSSNLATIGIRCMHLPT